LIGGYLRINDMKCRVTGAFRSRLPASLRALQETPKREGVLSYKDPEENTREQIKKVRSHPWIAKEVPVSGFIFDVDTGRLSEVKALEEERAA